MALFLSVCVCGEDLQEGKLKCHNNCAVLMSRVAYIGLTSCSHFHCLYSKLLPCIRKFSWDVPRKVKSVFCTLCNYME